MPERLLFLICVLGWSGCVKVAAGAPVWPEPGRVGRPLPHTSDSCRRTYVPGIKNVTAVHTVDGSVDGLCVRWDAVAQGEDVEIFVTTSGPCALKDVAVTVGDRNASLMSEPRRLRVSREAFMTGTFWVTALDACGHNIATTVTEYE